MVAFHRFFNIHGVLTECGISFRQEELAKRIWSQKEGLIQTGRAEKEDLESERRSHSDRKSGKRDLESERRSHSDRKSGKRESGVRKKVSFGQEELEKGVESERRSHSDRKSGKGIWSQKEGLIRTGRGKRDLESKKAIQTGRARKESWSLNVAPIRTGQEEK